MMIPVLIGVSLLIFALQFITPGDPANLERQDDAYHIYERAKLNLLESGDEYSDETILSVIEKTLSTKNNKNKELKELLSLSLRKIRSKSQEKKPKEKPSVSTDIDLTKFKPKQLDA